MSVRLGTISLAASLTGVAALTGDVINTAATADPSGSGLTSVLEPVLCGADLAGFLLGLVSSRAGGSGRGTAGLHLSWAPMVVALVLLAAYRPPLAAGLIERLAGLVLDVLNGVADTITLLLG